MKLSPSTIAANLAAAASYEAEAAASSNSNIPTTSSSSTTTNNQNFTSITSNNINMSSSHNPNVTFVTNQISGTSGTSKHSPKDSQIIAAILKEMGINEYEPRVLPQLVEFAYRYISHVLEDAQLFSSCARKKVIDTDDTSLAIQMQIDRSFVGPPSRDVLLEIARVKNLQPLPAIKSHNGMRLPADRYSLVAPNLRLKQKKTEKNPPTSYGVQSFTSLMTVNSNQTQKNLNSSTSLINKSQTSSLFNNFNSSDVYGVKRKFEDTKS